MPWLEHQSPDNAPSFQALVSVGCLMKRQNLGHPWTHGAVLDQFESFLQLSLGGCVRAKNRELLYDHQAWIEGHRSRFQVTDHHHSSAGRERTQALEKCTAADNLQDQVDALSEASPPHFGGKVEIGRDHDVVGSCGKQRDRKSTRLNSSHSSISYAVFCL